MGPNSQLSSLVARYLSHFRVYYPEILEWHAKLQDDLVTGCRRMFVLWDGMDVGGLAITKNGRRAKLCHISVSPKVRNRGLGRTLMQAALYDMACSGAQEIRVTTGEEVYRQHAPFFLGFGFEVMDWQVHRYRRGTSEILWNLEVASYLGRLREDESYFVPNCVEAKCACFPATLPFSFETSCRKAPLGVCACVGSGLLENCSVENEATSTTQYYRHILLDYLNTVEERTTRSLYRFEANGCAVDASSSMSAEMLRRYKRPNAFLDTMLIPNRLPQCESVNEASLTTGEGLVSDSTVSTYYTYPIATAQESYHQFSALHVLVSMPFSDCSKAKTTEAEWDS